MRFGCFEGALGMIAAVSQELFALEIVFSQPGGLGGAARRPEHVGQRGAVLPFAQSLGMRDDLVFFINKGLRIVDFPR